MVKLPLLKVFKYLQGILQTLSRYRFTSLGESRRRGIVGQGDAPNLGSYQNPTVQGFVNQENSYITKHT